MRWHDKSCAPRRAARSLAPDGTGDHQRDLQSQGASPDHIRDSLAGVDDLLAESLRAGLAEFARSLDVELHATVDETIQSPSRRVH